MDKHVPFINKVDITELKKTGKIKLSKKQKKEAINSGHIKKYYGFDIKIVEEHPDFINEWFDGEL